MANTHSKGHSEWRTSSSRPHRFVGRTVAPLLYMFSVTLIIFSVLLWLGLVSSFLDDRITREIGGRLENVVAALLVGAAVLVWRGGLRLSATAADEALEDCRPPILYIRSFANDDRRTGEQGPGVFSFVPKPRLEEQLTRALSILGPVIAIGRPGEKLPELGAARMYVGDNWQDEVLALHKAAQLVVVQAGFGAGLLWELRQIFQAPIFKPVLLCFPPVEGGGAPHEREYRYFKTLFEQELGVKMPDTLGNAHFVWFSTPSEGVAPQPVRLKSALAMETGPMGVGGPGFSAVWPMMDSISPGASAKMRIINGGKFRAVLTGVIYGVALLGMLVMAVGYLYIITPE